MGRGAIAIAKTQEVLPQDEEELLQFEGYRALEQLSREAVKSPYLETLRNHQDVLTERLDWMISKVMVNFAQAVREHWVHILVPLGFVIGCYLDRWNDERLSAFRNKSLLYKRELKPGEEVTWK